MGMDSTVRSAMLNCDAATRARRIGAANRFITDSNFCNLLQNIDINAPKKFNYGLFAAFTAVPGLAQQVQQWLREA